MNTTQEENNIRMANEEEVAEFAPPAEALGSTAAPVEGARGPEDETARLRAQVAELQDKYLRARAEVDNVVRRTQQDRADAVRYGNADLIKALLPVVDDMERTSAAAANQSGPVVEAVRLIAEKLSQLLKDQGVEPVEALHKAFNPAEHAALLQQPSKEHAPGTVIQEVQRGYRHRDRVLRPAQVIVAASPED